MDFINTAKAAVMLNIHPVTLRKKVKKREIPSYRVGKKWLFDPIELEIFIKNSQDRPKQEMGHKENICHVKSLASTKGAKFGTTRSRRPMVNGYAEVLGLTTNNKHRN
ncbi:helix-turn-helix domain-containing protein [Lonepinella sp. BR2930]|uniref:helix-turn-helix domain-containing protein n=1 Tax=Lonepinella sp. BR2930 TaxID=3434554 RepID=UPI003F6DE183